jgi:hypothetical protein
VRGAAAMEVADPARSRRPAKAATRSGIDAWTYINSHVTLGAHANGLRVVLTGTHPHAGGKELDLGGADRRGRLLDHPFPRGGGGRAWPLEPRPVRNIDLMPVLRSKYPSCWIPRPVHREGNLAETSMARRTMLELDAPKLVAETWHAWLSPRACFAYAILVSVALVSLPLAGSLPGSQPLPVSKYRGHWSPLPRMRRANAGHHCLASAGRGRFQGSTRCCACRAPYGGRSVPRHSRQGLDGTCRNSRCRRDGTVRDAGNIDYRLSLA